MNKVVRNTERKIIAGVCSGIAEHFSVDPLLIRLIAVVSVFVHGGVILLYLLLWMILPKRGSGAFNVSFSTTDTSFDERGSEEAYSPFSDVYEGETVRAKQETPVGNNVIGGIVLITLGGLLLANNFLPDIDIADYWPLLLVGVGAAVLLKALRSKNDL